MENIYLFYAPESQVWINANFFSIQFLDGLYVSEKGNVVEEA